MKPGQKIHFLSDFHLGVPDAASSLAREKRIVAFLDEATKALPSGEPAAAEIMLLGDLFDFWFEYKRAVPRGHVRLLGKLAELSDRGIPVHLFIGNHDMWIFDYVPKETGVIVHREPIVREIAGKRFLIGHGGRSRKKSYENDRKWLGAEKEWLVQYCKDELVKAHYDYMIFGHRHLPIDMEVQPGTMPDGRQARYINLGDWISYYTYATFDGQDMQLLKRMSDGPLEDDVRIIGAPAV